LKTGFISIRNAEGKQVYTAGYADKVDVSAFSSGIYYLQLLDEHKTVVETKKILIK